MVRQSRSDMDSVFGALADPTRRAILARLSQGDATVSELSEPHDMSLAAVSRHIHVLADAGLMSRVREGKRIRCRLNAQPLREATSWLAGYQAFWDQTLDALGEFLEGKDV
ncbi:helix-turn-helix transcriptional regulator [Denitrobaculum tricleocarpae]|uniref:Helix-turn-helix transcriptional regulator n=2 Tax=Denitrobaculum tricleocarpae TaxID=2591009 RepID=A0A545T0C4_9PROT|nr:helix-turn-helix transcriptional regulator [Denitrobaculum tricleocarpae]